MLFDCFTLNSFLVDEISRLNINDSYLHFYHFFWTNPWYIVVFFTTIFLIWIEFFIPSLFVLKNVIFIALFGYFLEIQSFFVSNYSLSIFNLNLSNFNTFLFNNFNKYHPFILYLSAAILLAFSFSNFTLLKSNYYFISIQKTYIRVDYVKIVLLALSATALFLGSWWASQEASWGGWWNWDSSETLGLLILLFSFFLLHLNTKFFFFLNYYFFIILNLIFTLISYFFIQLNFDLSSHNFGIKFFFFFNNNFFFIELINIILFFFLILIFIKHSQKSFFIKTLFPHNPITFFKLREFIISLLIMFIFLSILWSILSSYADIINFFFWSTFGFNAVNTEPDFTNLSYYLLLFLLVFFSNFNFFLFFFLIMFFLKSFYFSIIFIVPNLTYFFVIHFLLVNFFLSNIVSYYTESLNFMISSKYSDVFDYAVSILTFFKTHSLNLFFVEYSPFFYTNGSVLSGWFLENIFNPFMTSLFMLVSSNSFFLNLINLSHTPNSVFLFNDIPALSNLFFVFTLLLVLFNFSFFNKNKKIKNF